MGIKARLRITCDAANQDCEEGVDVMEGEESEARDKLEEQGWTITRRGDWCPRHEWSYISSL
jgi:hypothetical protein